MYFLLKTGDVPLPNMQANMHVPTLNGHLSGSLGIFFEIINATSDA